MISFYTYFIGWYCINLNFRPKPIPMTEKIPAFPRLGAVLNVKSTVRGRLAYNGLGNIRDALRREREKILESRDQV